MDKRHVLAAWIAGGLIWLGIVGGMAMLDDGVSRHPAEQLAETPHVPQEAPGTMRGSNDPA